MPLPCGMCSDNLFGALDLNNGGFKYVSDLGFTPAGLGVAGGTLYTAMGGGSQLYTLDTTTGVTTFLGNASAAYFAFGSTSDGLYMIDTAGSLWSVNPKNGSSTMLGSTHLNVENVQSIALSTGTNTLYLALNSDLYTISTTTGLASFIGTSGSTDFGALIDISGQVYANTVVSPNSVYIFNPATGVSSFVTLSTAPNYSFGLASVAPEPSSLALLGIGALIGVCALKRKRNIAQCTSGSEQTKFSHL